MMRVVGRFKFETNVCSKIQAKTIEALKKLSKENELEVVSTGDENRFILVDMEVSE